MATEDGDGQTDVVFLINVLFDHNMSWIQQFLRDRGLSAKGTKPELRERVESFVEDGTLTEADLVDLLDEVEGWGNQHVFLYKASDALVADLTDDKKLKETLRELGLVRLFNRRKPLVLPNEPTVSSIAWTPQRIRFIWVERREYRERRDDASYTEGPIEYDAFEVVQSRGIVTFSCDLVSGLAELLIQRLPSGNDYLAEKKKYQLELAKFFDIAQLSPQKISGAIKKVDQAAGIRKRSSQLATALGYQVTYTSRSGRTTFTPTRPFAKHGRLWDQPSPVASVISTGRSRAETFTSSFTRRISISAFSGNARLRRWKVYFRKSADIVKAHQTLAREVELVDDLIYAIGDHPIRAGQVSDNLGIDESLLLRILGLYVAADILRREKRRYCRSCDSLIDEDNDPKECDNCEAKFSQTKPHFVEIFAPVDPVVRVQLDDDEDADDVAPVRIQFVGGDRGGGQLNQLQTPKEYDSIKSGIKATEYADRLELADPVYAAKLSDLGTLYPTNRRLLHFAGQGDDRSLSFIKDQELLAATVKVTAERIGKILRAYPAPISVVVFNTCASALMAEGLVATDTVDIAIGWEGRVPDSVAIAFAHQFYTHIGNGLSVGPAFVLASECAAPEDAAYRGAIFSGKGVNPKTYCLLTI